MRPRGNVMKESLSLSLWLLGTGLLDGCAGGNASVPPARDHRRSVSYFGPGTIRVLRIRKFSMRSSLKMLGVTMSLFLLLLGNPMKLPAIEFAAAKSYPVGTSPAGIAVGDFNGDGKPDIAVANTGSGNVSILLGNGDGTFQPAVNYSAGNSPSGIALGDFNGDGKLDLAV